MSDKVLKCALEYAQYGWHILPLASKGKTPIGRLVPHGVKDASRDKDVIKKWFSKTNYNVGIATGPKSGIWILDIDGPVGAVVWWDFEARHGSVFTLAQRTGRIDGGRQLFFRYPQSYIVRSKTRIVPGIDVRGEGGYVVAPPSIHESGKRYTWEGRVPINPAPSRLLKLVATKTPPTTTSRPSSPSLSKSLTTNYGKAAIDGLLEELSSCPRGGRDSTGYRVAVRLLKLEASGYVAPGTAENVLREGFAKNGYLEDKRHERGERGLQRILNSARRKAQQ